MGGKTPANKTRYRDGGRLAPCASRPDGGLDFLPFALNAVRTRVRYNVARKSGATLAEIEAALVHASARRVEFGARGDQPAWEQANREVWEFDDRWWEAI